MYALIMAGGFGTRFWPASRNNLPKQFLNIIGSDCLLKQTVERLSGLINEENCIVIVNEMHKDLTTQILSNDKIKVITEPVGRNTASCIGLAAIHFAKENPDEPMVILPSDHYISDQISFKETLKATLPYAKDGHLVTIGIRATRPETGYGYIRKGEQYSKNHGFPTYKVENFVEKPDLKTAVSYLVSKNYFWNAGIFIFKPDVILKEIQEHLPDVYDFLMEIQKLIGTDKYNDVVAEVYPKMPSISIDYGIMEKTKNPITVVEGNFGWSDVGSWLSLYQLRESDKDSLLNIADGKTVLFDTQKSFIVNQSNDKVIVTLGLKDFLLVNTPDVILAMNLQEGQRIKEVVDKLKDDDHFNNFL